MILPISAAIHLDFGTYIRNYARKCGLNIIADLVFDVMLQAMQIIVTVVTVDDFETNTSGVWKRVKILVLQNQSLRSDFITRSS